MKMKRKEFIRQTGFLAVGSVLLEGLNAAALQANRNPESGKPVNILLRSGWQVENIGDIAHTPAMLALIEKYIPQAIVTFWPWYDYLPDDEVRMLQARFPKMGLARGKMNEKGGGSTPELEAAIATADLFLHNSGPATIGWADATNFKKRTGKLFGVFGVTYGLYGTPETATLSDAAFVYFRDSISLQKAKEAGVHAPIMAFGPDAVFSIDVTDDEKAIAFLKKAKLREGKYLCCIPKQRHTPSWLHKQKGRPVDAVKHARNEEMKEHDHLPLRAAITEVVRKTGLKVLICHEDETEMPIGKEWVLDKLPEDVKSKVVWLGRSWLTDEAISIYKRSAGHFGLEMHSPIMCIAQGIPAIVVRWEEQSSKGFMWKDIGLADWLFDFDKQEDIKRFVPTVLAMAKDPKGSKKKAEKARAFVHVQLQEGMMQMKKTIEENKKIS